MAIITTCEHFPVDIDDLALPKAPTWWLKSRSSPESLKLSHDQERVVRMYCYAVAMDESSWERSALHKVVCRELGIDREVFAPFEDERMTKIPTPDEAVSFFWEMLSEYYINKSR